MKIYDVIKQWGAAAIAKSCSLLGVAEASTVRSLNLKAKPKRYSLAELLIGATAKNVKALNAETAWALEGDAVGEELL